MAVALRRAAKAAPPSWLLSSRLFCSSSILLRQPGKSTGKGYAYKPSQRPSYNKGFARPPPKSTGPTDWHERRHRLAIGIKAWCKDPSVEKTLLSFGLDASHTKQLLRGFVDMGHAELSVRDKDADEVHKRWHFPRLADAFEESFERALYKAYMNRLVDYAIGPDSPLPSSQSYHLQRLRDATNLDHPGQWYAKARTLKRKIILHVGPTNSGKTYNALRALAAAPTGVYGGPLRLLAHEVWERLNNGSIMAPPKNTAVDLLDAAPVEDVDLGKQPLPQGRACNLITGEERRIVDQHAGLVSCTMEMVPTAKLYDVAVIDEIQMINDKDRGSAWTQAVLGVWAKEVHLCGEDTVVDLIRRIAEETGDELEVHHYKRLTPLHISEPINGDWKQIQKGDCVVCFSRKAIFDIKSKIEASTGLRCAVAYGKLPPEVRSEQAQRFNDPDSGFDVLVASDAVGMGLNLKIKRLIFSSLNKWSGTEMLPLSLSQTKQIAGRAGRFGTGTDGAGGSVTTFYANDLPRLREAMESENPTVTRAYVELGSPLINKVYSSLPHGSGFHHTHTILDLLTMPNELYTPKLYRSGLDSTQLIDQLGRDAPFNDLHLFLTAPIQWRDENSRKAQLKLIETYFRDLIVPLSDALSMTGAGIAIEDAKEMQKKISIMEEVDGVQVFKGIHSDEAEKNQKDISGIIDSLESAHRLVTLYLWLSYRLPLAFCDQDQAFDVKDGIEGSMDFLLVSLQSKSQQVLAEARTLESDVAVKPFEWEYENRGPVYPRFNKMETQRTTERHLPF